MHSITKFWFILPHTINLWTSSTLLSFNKKINYDKYLVLYTGFTDPWTVARQFQNNQLFETKKMFVIYYLKNIVAPPTHHKQKVEYYASIQ